MTPSRRQWVLDEEAAEPIVRRAIELGVTFFDTADMYAGGASEQRHRPAAAQAHHPRGSSSSRRRSSIPTAAGPNGGGLSRKHILAAIDASLRRLQTRLRRPVPDPPLGPRDADRGDHGGAARRGAQRQGPLHRRLHDVRLAVRQGAAHRRAPRLDPIRLDAEPLQPGLPRGGARDDPALPDQGVGVIPWSPLARGFLAGNARATASGRTAARRVRSVQTSSTAATPTSTSSSGCSRSPPSAACPPAQVALAWLLHKPGVTAPIVGRDARSPTSRTRPPRLRSN